MGGSSSIDGDHVTNKQLVYIYIYFLAPDNESQGSLNPTAMTVQKLVILHRRE